MAIDIITNPTTIVIDIAKVSGPKGDPGEPGEPGETGPAGATGPAGSSGAGTLVVQPIEEPPVPAEDGVQWYDPSSGTIRVSYDGAWVPLGVPAPTSPTSLVGQAVGVTVGPVLTLVKLLDLPVPYFDGGNAYWTQFPDAFAAGMSDPSFFAFNVWYSPAQDGHAERLFAAGINGYDVIEENLGNIGFAIAAGMRIQPQINFWSTDMVNAENPDDSPLVTGWHTIDEPDMFHDLGYVISQVDAIHAKNDGRYSSINLGAGIYGGPLWSPTTIDDMARYADVVSCDSYVYSSAYQRTYVVTQGPAWTGSTNPDLVRRAASYGWQADRLRSYQDPNNPKPYGVVIETAKPFLHDPFDATAPHITLPEISGAVWSAIRHGSRIIGFFQHNNDPELPFYSISEESSTAIRAQVTRLTSEVSALAPVIDGPTYEWDFGDPDVETMLKAYDGNAYIFAGSSLNSVMPGRGETDIEQVGDVLQFQFTDTADTGTVSSAIEVPAGTEIVVVAVSGRHGTANGFDAMTFTKGGVDTAMVKVTGGDVSGASWQSAIFYMVLPDTGAGKTLKWDWAGVASDGERVVAVTFWKGIDLAIPLRDSAGFQEAGFALEAPILLETSSLDVANGDLVVAFCGMYNAAGDGSAKITVWHHMTRLTDLTHEDSAEGMLATATPDGNCTVGITNISVATELAFVAVVLKKATLQAVTSTITQIGASSALSSTVSRDNSGTFFYLIDVPIGTEFALAAVSSFIGVEDGFVEITMLKGGVQTPMTRLTGGDASIETWQGALFYMVEPDIGDDLAMTWDWGGSSNVSNSSILSVTFWAGVDLADPIRDSNGVQNLRIYPGGPINPLPLNTPMLTNREGDLIVAYFGAYRPGLSEGSVDVWKNLNLLEQGLAIDFADYAWATNAVIGSVQVGVTETTILAEGALVVAVLKPDAAVTPATPDVEPATTARSVITATFTLPPDLAGATSVEVLNESRSISVTAGAFTDTFDEEYTYHNYRIPI